jgi:peptidoglycan/xylan/chitin deacetylase (PgdA/CDA1 family)
MFDKKTLISIAFIIFVIDLMLVAIKVTHQKEDSKIIDRRDDMDFLVIPIHKSKPHYKYSVFLTSDDGVLSGSRNLNKIIDSYEVPFTIFLVGRPVSQDKKLISNLERYKRNSYVILGNHSFSHASFHYKRYYSDPIGVTKDFIINQNYLLIESKLGRLPGRNVWVLNSSIYRGEPNALKAGKLLYKRYNYKIFGWDYELKHKRGKMVRSAEEHYRIIKKLLKRGKTFTKNQIVILMHDQMFTKDRSSRELKRLIALLQNDDEIKLKYLTQYRVPFRRR